MKERKLKKTEVLVNGRIWTKEDLQKLILSNDEALVKALYRIYNKQTEDEKDDEDTKVWNTVGFSGVDGHIMSKMVSWYDSKKFFTPKQKTLIQKKMKKYCGQLLRLMAEDNISENQHFFKVRKGKD